MSCPRYTRGLLSSATPPAGPQASCWRGSGADSGPGPAPAPATKALPCQGRPHTASPASPAPETRRPGQLSPHPSPGPTRVPGPSAPLTPPAPLPSHTPGPGHGRALLGPHGAGLPRAAGGRRRRRGPGRARAAPGARPPRYLRCPPPPAAAVAPRPRSARREARLGEQDNMAPAAAHPEAERVTALTRAGAARLHLY